MASIDHPHWEVMRSQIVDGIEGKAEAYDWLEQLIESVSAVNHRGTSKCWSQLDSSHEASVAEQSYKACQVTPTQPQNGWVGKPAS